MQVIVPMSGRGERFVRAGYTDIKPLIEIDGLPMIAHVVALFPGDTRFIFVCAEDHLRNTTLKSVLKSITPTGTVVEIPPHKLGPVWTVLQAASVLDPDQPAIVSYCDFSANWNYAKFVDFVQKTGCDGCIPSYRDFHPHSLGPNLYAYLRTSGDRVLEVREKGAFTQDRMREYASAGIYYFRSAQQLKTYFRRAVEIRLDYNGEYYASLPYNLLIQDGLDVRVFDIEHFLQWGTPEDLEEYKSWSKWFGHWDAWQPKRTLSAFTIVPCAGLGKRFSDQGYELPKPLISVDGTPMLARTLACLPPTKGTVIAVQESLRQDSALRQLVHDRTTCSTEIFYTGRTQGQAHTCLIAAAQRDRCDSILFSSCDAAFAYDEERFLEIVADSTIDLIVWTFRNHPEANHKPTQYGWCRVREDSTLVALSCKKPVSADVKKDPGVTGTFWFRRAGDFVEEAQRMMDQNERINGEFYVDSVVARLVAKGVKAKAFEVTHFICFGTPEDVRTYEYWANYFRWKAATEGSNG